MFTPDGNSLTTIFSIFAWFACSMALIFTNRYIFIDLDFDFPITLTAWHLVIATFVTRLLHAFTSRMDQVAETNEILTWRRWATSVLPIGIFFSFSLGFANYSYLYLSVPFIQMLKSGTPIAILLVSWAFGTEKPNWSTLVNILVICFGVGLASYGELHYRLIGFIFVILGITFESVRLVLIQKLLKGQGLAMDAMTALYYFAPVCAFFNICAASIDEFHKITPTHLQQLGVWTILVNGALSFGLNLASVTVVKQTSTLVLGLSGLIKDIIIVCAASLYFGTSITALQFGGYSVALLGLARYKLHKEESWIKFWEPIHDTKRANFRIILAIIILLLTAGLYELRPSTTSMQETLPPRPPRNLNALYNSEAQSNSTMSKRDLMIDRLYAMGEVSWPEYLSRLDSGGLAPLTKEVQNWIYEWQHPPASECSKKKFMISKGWHSGLGSMIHVTGDHLSVALDQDRIMVLADNNHNKMYADEGCGTNKPYTGQECFFQSLSSCTYKDANAWGADSKRVSFDPEKPYGAPKYWIERLKQEFPHADLTDGFFKYWWRAQSAAYLMRLNSETSRTLLELRKDPSLHHAWTRASSANNTSEPMPYPLPSGTMNMHVRHGDKAKEMTLVPFTKYVDVGLQMIRLNPLSFQRRVFVSSEDPGVITDAIQLTKEPLDTVTGPAATWEIYTSDIPRINDSPFAQLNAYGKSRMTHFWLLQLMMVLECDAFVGTRGSNWNRLIDELRCVWVDRCTSPYMEVGPDKDWVKYSWK